MSFTKELKSWFFRTGAPTNARGKKINLNSTGEPDQDLFERLAASTIFFRNTEDRAKQSTGAEATEDLVGHVQIETDANAKSNTDGLQAGTTKVVHAGQLPTVDATEAQVISDFNDVALSVADDGTLTRNNFLAKLSTNFVTWLGNLKDSVVANIAEITSLRTLSGTLSGENDLGTFSGNTITNNVDVKTALEELETAVENVAGGTISSGSSPKAYVNVTEAPPGNLSIDVIEATFRSNVTDNYYVNAVNDHTAGTVGLVDNAVPLTPKVRQMLNSSSVDWSIDGSNRVIGAVNEAWLNNIINTAILAGGGSGGGGLGPGEKAYLFKAEKSSSQVITSKMIETGTTNASDVVGGFVLFEDDSTLPNFDNGGVWGINKFIHAEASAVDMSFNVDGVTATSGIFGIVKRLSLPGVVQSKTLCMTTNDGFIATTDLTRVGSIVTVTYDNNGGTEIIETGQEVKIAGVTPATFNFTATATRVSDSSFTVVDPVTTTGESATIQGTITSETANITINSLLANNIYYISFGDNDNPAPSDDITVTFNNPTQDSSNANTTLTELITSTYNRTGLIIIPTGTSISIDISKSSAGAADKNNLTYEVSYLGVESISDVVDHTTLASAGLSSNYDSIAPGDDIRLLGLNEGGPSTVNISAGVIYNQD